MHHEEVVGWQSRRIEKDSASLQVLLLLAMQYIWHEMPGELRPIVMLRGIEIRSPHLACRILEDIVARNETTDLALCHLALRSFPPYTVMAW